MKRSDVPVPHPQVAVQLVDGEAIIVLADSGKVKVLNEIGTRLWELVDGFRTVQEIADVISTEYDVTLEKALDDASSFYKVLMDADVLIIKGDNRKSTDD